MKKQKSENFLPIKEYNYIFIELNKLPKEINALINFTNEKLAI